MSTPSSNLKSAPITAHRAFPAIVALWFAALLGIGSLVVPPERLSSVVSALGIPRFVPAAAPPLGFTARALLALAMAGVGVLVGLAIGWKLARRPVEQPRRRTDPTRGRSAAPVRTHADDPAAHQAAADAEPEQEPVSLRRGPLRASEAFADIEPLLDTPAADRVSNGQREDIPEDDFAVLGAPRGEDDETGRYEPEFLSEPEPEPEPATEPEQSSGRPEAVAMHTACEPTAPKPEFAAERSAIGTLHALANAPLGSLGTVQLVERLAMAMAAASKGAPTVGEKPEITSVSIEPSGFVARQPGSQDEAGGDPAEPGIDEASLPSVSAAGSDHINDEAVVPEPASGAAPLRWAAPDFAEQAGVAMPEPDAPTRPSILEPVAHAWDDATEDDEPTIAPPRFLSSRMSSTADGRADRFAAPHTARPAEPAGDREDFADSASDDRYPSLLDIQPAPREAIRITAPDAAPEPPLAEPVVVFPGAGPRGHAPFAPPPASALQSRRSLPFDAPQGTPISAPELPAEPVDADEADRALRAALATLQRMSGAR